MSFRARVFTASLVTLAIGLGAVLTLGNVLLDRRVAAETSGLLRGRADAEIAALTVVHGRVQVRETANDDQLDQAAWVLDRGRVVERPATGPATLDRLAVSLGPGEHAGPGAQRLLVRPVPGTAATVVVAVSERPLERLEHSVWLGSLVVAALLLLAGAIAIRSAVDGAMEPIRHLTRAADDAAHELRTPLAALRGRTELALLGPPSAHEAALRAVLAQAERLDRTVEALLAVARHELEPTAGRTDLVALVTELDDVELEVSAGVPAARADPEVVRRALAPLVENARRHARTAVQVEVGRRRRKVTVTVRDDGPGLDPAIGERAFEPGISAREGGSGLGLALARRLARSCGGDVRAGGGPGGCFVLSLPAVR